MATHIGIDYGEKRVGVALSDEAEKIAFPHAVLENGPGLLAALAALVEEKKAETVVFGYSRNYAGEENPIAARASALARALGEKTGATIAFADETLTSAQARRQFEQKEKTREPLRREIVDASAAALILETYLASIRKK